MVFISGKMGPPAVPFRMKMEPGRTSRSSFDGRDWKLPII
jgi:hypothetical protein